MGTGWRRAFCTSIRRDPEATTSSTLERRQQQQQQQQQQSPSIRSSRNCVKLGIGGGGGLFSGSGSGGSSNPSTPRLSRSTTSTPRFRTTSPPTPQSLDSPKLQCKTTTTMMTESSDAAASAATIPNWKGSRPRLFDQSSSPRSPSRFALLKTALRLSRNRCGVCGDGVSAGGQRTAIFTAECSHAFHFPCISTHVRTQGCLVCPVCSATWHEVSLLSSSLHVHSPAGRPQQHGNRGGHSSKLGERNSSSSRGRREGERAASAGTTKIYDDDESLQLSPTSGIADGLLQFNPIPEELDAEVDGEELQDQADQGDCGEEREQGSSGDGIETISVVPDSLALVSTGRNHLSYVVSIIVKAPPLPQWPQAAAVVDANSSINKHVVTPAVVPPNMLDHPSCRAPIDLVTVLDVSRSMTVDKLQMLKRAMRLVISSLGPGDRLSIVAFSTAAAKRLFPLRRMSRPGQRSARQIVDRLVICGSTQAQGQSHHCSSTSCMGDALRKATKVLEDRREHNPVATIMLLSDGYRHGHDQQQQEVEKDVHDTISSSRSQNPQPSSATRFTHIEIPIHASGSFRHLQQQQKQRRSPNNNIPALEEEDGFAKCVNELMSMVLQDVHLQFTFPSACGVISSVYSYGGECIGQAMSHGEGGKSVLLGDMYAEEERQLLVELKVPKATVVSGHSMSISVMCSYRDPLTRDVIHCGERPLRMSMSMPIQSEGQNHSLTDHQISMMLRSTSSSSSSTTIASSTQQQQQQLRNLFVTTRAMAESRRLVELSDLGTALHLLSSARSLLLQRSAAVSNTQKKLVLSLEAQLKDLQRQQQQQSLQSLSPYQRRSEEAVLGEATGGGEPLTPTSAWRAAEQLAKVAIMRKSLNRISDLHGLENARF